MQPRRILYVGPMGKGQTCLHRCWALERLGQQMSFFDIRPYRFQFKLLNALQFRYPVGPFIARINRDLRARIRDERPEVIWFDRPTLFDRRTLELAGTLGIRSVCCCIDNPMGPRRDGCWHQFFRTLDQYSLHALFRNADIPRYEALGLPWVKIQLSYEPSVHFPPPPEWQEEERDWPVAYIGHPHEQRAAFLRTLIEREKLPIVIAGNGWQNVVTGEERARWEREGHLQDAAGMFVDAAYREAIWRCKICISFVTELNEEDVAHKAFEITASGSFLLAKRTPGHQACFAEGKEAEFFDSVEECAEKIRYYLAHPHERQEIARRGCERAKASGYDNDTQMARILNKLATMRS